MTIQSVKHRTGLHDPASKIHGTRPRRLGEEATGEAALIRAAGYLERDSDLSSNLVEALIDLSAYQVSLDALDRAAETLTRAVRKADDTFPLLRWEVGVRAAIVHRLLPRSFPVQPPAGPDLREADPILADAQDVLTALRPGEQPQQRARDQLINLLTSNARHHAQRVPVPGTTRNSVKIPRSRQKPDEGHTEADLRQ